MLIRWKPSTSLLLPIVGAMDFCEFGPLKKSLWAPLCGYSVDFVGFDRIDRMVGVSTYQPQATIRPALLNHEERAPTAVVQGAAPDSECPRNEADHSK
jgi:hypothetical protein